MWNVSNKVSRRAFFPAHIHSARFDPFILPLDSVTTQHSATFLAHVKLHIFINSLLFQTKSAFVRFKCFLTVLTGLRKCNSLFMQL